MADRLSWLGFTRICVVHGAVSWPGEGDGAGQLQLWYHEGSNSYGIYAVKTAGRGILVRELLINVLLFHSQECTEKIKTLLTKKSKFHFVQYLSVKQIVPCTEA